MSKKPLVGPMQKRTWKDKKRKAVAICYVFKNGKRTQKTLGHWGTQEAQDAYARIIAESQSEFADIDNYSDVTVAMLCSAFCKDAQQRADNERLKFATKDLNHYKTAIRQLIRLYGDTPVTKFNASCFRAFRQHLVNIAPTTEKKICGVYANNERNIKKGVAGKPKYIYTKKPWTENYVKTLTRYVKIIFSWGVGHDLVPPAVSDRFKHVETLQSDLDVKQPRLDVSDDIIKKTLPWLTPTVRDMVIIQRQNALRPNEVCNLRVGDIDKSGEFWTVTKMTKTKVPMIIKFCQSDREIIARRIKNKGADEFVFTPIEAVQEQWAEKANTRQTKVQPCQQARAERVKDTKLNRYKPCYDVNSYRRAIEYAIKKARKNGVNIPHWTPYQLRHTAVTVTSYEHGREAASMLAGHTNTTTTLIYEHKIERVKEDLARERQAYWTEDME